MQSDQDLAWEDGAIVLGVSVSRELQGWWQRSRLCSKERKAGLARCPGRQADYELLPFQGPFLTDTLRWVGAMAVAAATVRGEGQPHY